MKVQDTHERETVAFKDVEPGTLFGWAGEWFVKTHGECPRCASNANAMDGHRRCFLPTDRVTVYPNAVIHTNSGGA